MSEQNLKEIAEVCFRAVTPNLAEIWTPEKKEKHYLMYKEHWAKVAGIIAQLNVGIEEYTKGVMYPLWSETYYPRWMHSKFFSKPWAVDKFADYKILKENGNLTAVNMEKKLIDRTVEVINQYDNYWEAGTKILPQVCVDVFKRKVAISYLSVNKQFKDLIRKLPKDIKEEFFEEDSLYNLEQVVRATPEIYRYIRSKNGNKT